MDATTEPPPHVAPAEQSAQTNVVSRLGGHLGWGRAGLNLAALAAVDYFPWRAIGLGLEAEYGKTGDWFPRFGNPKPSHEDHDVVGALRGRVAYRLRFGHSRFGFGASAAGGVARLHHQKVTESKLMRAPEYDCGLDPFCDEWQTVFHVAPAKDELVWSGAAEALAFARFNRLEIGISVRGTVALPAYYVNFGPYIGFVL